ncbi:MAG TPA: hypothetical protein VNS63_18165 [Blastocatellia bacterium]|nr:hypothetical protein [Blastocatellia bacterium]
MSPKTMRLVGIACMVVAVVLMILNLRRVANLGTYWIALLFFFVGAVFAVRSRRQKKV